MFKYKNLATLAISIDLQNGYAIIAMANWNNDNKKYIVDLYIKHNTIQLLELMEDVSSVEFESDIKTIKTDIAKYVYEAFYNDCFNYYIERYDYDQACFDKGDDFFERERLSDK